MGQSLALPAVRRSPAHLIGWMFGLVKLTGYGEQELLVFMAVDLVVIALLALIHTRR
jgi:hypothetical protein